MLNKVDWSKTILGPASEWPSTLKTVIRLCASSPLPMMVLWGQELIQLYNDAFKPIMGEKYAEAFARSFYENGPEGLQLNRSFYQQVVEDGETVYVEDQRFLIWDDGVTQEAYFTLCYSPIVGEDGNTGGILVTATDTTERTVQRRWFRILESLDRLECRRQHVADGLVELLAENRQEFPFGLLYLKDETEAIAHLQAFFGIEAGQLYSPARISLDVVDSTTWPLVETAGGGPVRVTDLRQRFSGFVVNDDSKAPEEAIVAPLINPASESLLGMLVLGLNPYRRYQGAYERFCSLVVHRLASILGTVQGSMAAQKERQFLQDLFDKIPVMITMYEPDMEFLWFNDLFERLLGWTTGEARQVNFDLMEKFYPDRAYREQVQAFMRSLEPGWRDFRVTAKDGTVVDSMWANIRLSGNRQVGIGIDIRERKKAERALRESEERLQAAVEAAEVGIWHVNFETGLMRRDASLCRILGLNPDHGPWPIEDFFARVHEDDREYVRAAWERALKGNGIYDVECRIVRSDGQVRWIRDRGRLETNGEGKPSYITGAALDITERKQAEVALRESEERFRLAARAANDAVWDFNLLTGEVLWSEAMVSAFGHDDAIRATSRDWWIERIHAEDRARVLESIEAAFSANARRWLAQYRFRCGDGSYAFVLDRGFVQHDAEGHPVRMIGAMQDQTEQKQAEQALRESESRFRKVVMQAPTPLLVFAEDGEVFYANRAWTTLTGYTASEMPTIKAWAEQACQNDLPKSELLADRLLKETHELDRVEFHIYRRGGARRTILVSATSLGQLSDGKGLRAAAAIDITERKQAEQALQELNETLEARVEARTAQVRDLTAMLTFAEQRERDRIAQILHDDLQQLLYALQLQLTMLTVENLETNREELQALLSHAIGTTLSLTVDLSPPVLRGEGLDAAIAWLANQMKELHDLDVSIHSEGVRLVHHKEMRVLLFQLVRELLFNVVKHAATEQAFVSLTQQADQLRITVRDEGCGFDLPYVLEQHGVDGPYGLFSIRERLALLGGDLQIETAPGEGTCVTIIMPGAE